MFIFTALAAASLLVPSAFSAEPRIITFTGENCERGGAAAPYSDEPRSRAGLGNSNARFALDAGAEQNLTKFPTFKSAQERSNNFPIKSISIHKDYTVAATLIPLEEIGINAWSLSLMFGPHVRLNGVKVPGINQVKDADQNVHYFAGLSNVENVQWEPSHPNFRIEGMARAGMRCYSYKLQNHSTYADAGYAMFDFSDKGYYSVIKRDRDALLEGSMSSTPPA